MTTIFVQYERDCYSMIYKRSDAKNITVIQGFLGPLPMFAEVRRAHERYEDFYQRVVEQMSDIVFSHTSFREEQGLEGRGEQATMILVDMECELNWYHSLQPDHVVDEPEYVAARKGYSDYLMSKVMRWPEQ